jgi:hypothetical protein
LQDVDQRKLVGISHADLGAFAELRKGITNFVMSVCQPAWNHSALTGRILMKFGILAFFFGKAVGKMQVSVQFDKNNGYFT